MVGRGIKKKMDLIAGKISERALRFPLTKINTFILGRDTGQKIAVMWTGQAFVARAYCHYFSGRHGAALADLSAARRLSCDLADCLPLGQKDFALSVRSHIFAFLRRTLTESFLESQVPNEYVAWLLEDPDLVSYSSGIAHEETGFLEIVAGAFVADADGKDVHFDLIKLDQIFEGSLGEWGGMTPRHHEFAKNLRPEGVRPIAQSIFGRMEAWDSIIQTQIKASRQEFGSWLEEERRFNPLLFHVGIYGSIYEAKLCVRAARKALRLVAHLIRYRQDYGEWPGERLADLLGDCEECLIDPVTGVPFEIDYPGGTPRIRSATGHAGLFSEKVLSWIQGAAWVSPGDTRLTYFSASRTW